MTSSERKTSRWLLAASLSVGLLAVPVVSAWLPVLPTGASAQAQVRLRGYVNQTMRRANQLFQAGKVKEAETVYTQALQRNPGNDNYRSALALVQAELYKLDSAEKNADQALKKNPKNPYAHIAKGVVARYRTSSSDMTYRARRAELLTEAESHFKTALRFDSDNPEAYNMLGEVYRDQGRLDEARQAFEKAVNLDSNYANALTNLGTVYHAQGNHAEAMSHFQQAIRVNSKHSAAHYYMGSAQLERGDTHGAIKHLNNALYLNRNAPHILTKLGEAYQRQGNEAAAVENYKKAIQLKPEYGEAHRKLSALYDYRGDGELAVAQLKSGLNANPAYTPFKLDIARLSLAVDKPDQAVLYYKDVLSTDPGNAEALEGLAQSYQRSAQRTASNAAVGGADDLVDAEQAIDQALQAQPNSLSLHLAKLRLQQLSGKPDDARDTWTRISQMPPRNEVEQAMQGQALFALGRYQESDAVFRQMIQANQNDPQKLLKVADMLKMNGDLDMAAEAYKTVQMKQPDNLKARRGLQRIEVSRQEADRSLRLATALNNWWSQKQRDSAMDLYLDTLNRYPRSSDAHLALGKLYARENEYGKAVVQYESYLNLNPNMPADERQRLEKTVARYRERAGKRGQSIE
ncbi:MAG: tetratricopeptide repeat protein [Candidatus Melainabacteria bacterium]|nr:tetratricopeptide repeat protein [Candidatus Melainabacteria bacterium]